MVKLVGVYSTIIVARWVGGGGCQVKTLSADTHQRTLALAQLANAKMRLVNLSHRAIARPAF